MNGFRHHRRSYPFPGAYPVAYPVVAESDGSSCGCKGGASAGGNDLISKITEQIKENPGIWVIGALVLGSILGRKR